jgi:hypothetical protein
VLEDVVTTGGSSLKAVTRLPPGRLRPWNRVVTVVDRQEGGQEAMTAAAELELVSLFLAGGGGGHPSRPASSHEQHRKRPIRWAPVPRSPHQQTLLAVQDAREPAPPIALFPGPRADPWGGAR